MDRESRPRRKQPPTGVEIRPGKQRDTLRIVFQFKGRRCREPLDIEATDGNLKYAANLRGEILNKIALGTFSYRDYFPNSKMATKLGIAKVEDPLVKDLLDEYLATAEKTLSPSTVRGYKEVSNAHLYPAFGDMTVRSLSSRVIRTYLASLDLSHKRVKNILCPLSNILNQALDDEIIDANPLKKIVLDKILPQENESDYEVDPFDQEEIAAILQACPTIEERAYWQAAFATGLRTSEQIALRWSDFDWLKTEYRVSRAKVVGHDGPVEKKRTKTKGSTRTLPILPAFHEAVQLMKPITFLANGPVFICPWTGNQWQDDKQLRESSWRRILRKAGVRYRNPYQTRHTFATTLLMNGESEMLVAQLLGHTTTEMVRRIYGKWIKSASLIPRGDYSNVFSIGSAPGVEGRMRNAS